MYRLRYTTAFLACCTWIPIADVEADPVEWPISESGNGHFYQHFLAPRLSWDEAKSFAESLTLAGVSGHLATMTSESEWRFVQSVRGGESGPGGTWVGGFQDELAPDYLEPDGGWRWVTDEPWSFEDWRFTEPNDFEGGEGSLEVFAGYWNDERSTSTRGFIVEFSVPEPAAATTVAFAAIAFIALIRAQHRIASG